MNGLLVIGYGNPLRGDDGAGPEAARRVERLGLPGVVVIECHQLLPEHAETLSRFDRAILIDAHAELDGGDIQVLEVAPAEDPQLGSHASDPASLLALAEVLYHRHPRSTLIALPTRDFDLREGLSPLAEKGVGQAVAHIRTLIQGESTDFTRPQADHPPR